MWPFKSTTAALDANRSPPHPAAPYDATFLDAIDALDACRSVFGSSRHQYKAHPLSTNQLESFQRWCGCSLPRSYTRHLVEVGFGAGPNYGLLSPDEIKRELSALCDDAREDESHLAGRPFPISDTVLSLKAESPNGCEPFEAPDLPHGYIPVSFIGCEYMMVMVTTGPCSGMVFETTGDEWAPPFCAASGVQDRHSGLIKLQWPTFTQWINAWVQQCFRDLIGNTA